MTVIPACVPGAPVFSASNDSSESGVGLHIRLADMSAPLSAYQGRRSQRKARSCGRYPLISAFITIAAAALMVAVDQMIKLWATVNLAPVGSMPLIPGIVELRYYLNDGAAFSILQGKQTFLIFFTGIALLAVAVYLLFRKPKKNLEYIGWLLVLGGGIGNFVDRVTNQEVVDYINLLFMDFAIFNLADILLCTGIGLLILSLVLEEVAARRGRSKEQPAADPEEQDGAL